MMGTMGFGRKVREDGDSVRYEFGVDPAVVEGVLVVPVADVDSWYVQGSDDRPFTAQIVLHKALRLHRRDRAWPVDASFYS
jgi:hypothetical protein